MTWPRLLASSPPWQAGAANRYGPAVPCPADYAPIRHSWLADLIASASYLLPLSLCIDSSSSCSSAWHTLVSSDCGHTHPFQTSDVLPLPEFQSRDSCALDFLPFDVVASFDFTNFLFYANFLDCFVTPSDDVVAVVVLMISFVPVCCRVLRARALNTRLVRRRLRSRLVAAAASSSD